MILDAGIIVKAINGACGDPSIAIKHATENYSGVDEWIEWNAGKSALLGALTALIPVINLLLIPADLYFLANRLAYVCQGIAGLNRVSIDAESSKGDLAAILGLWAGVVEEHELEEIFIHEAETGVMELPKIRKNNPKNEYLECPLQTTDEIVGVAKVGKKALGTMGGIFVRMVGKEVAAQLAPKIAASGTSRLFSLAGAIISGGTNFEMIEEVGRCGDVYYTKKRAFFDRNGNTKTVA